MIDPNKTYRTRSGEAVRIYATDGGDKAVHGAFWSPLSGWIIMCWHQDGSYHGGNREYDLIEVTLADELSDQIPWEALRSEIQWVSMDATGQWYAHENAPTATEVSGWVSMSSGFGNSRASCCGPLSPVLMPVIKNELWRETLCKRPEGR